MRVYYSKTNTSSILVICFSWGRKEARVKRQYIAIDLKSFYASVECVERGLDALSAKLVVADPERTDKTICLAVSPALKKLGVKNRCRVFEIPKNIDYIMAPPRMQLYIDYSTKIYSVYLQFVSSDDIHPYSIDEVFMDVTHYLSMYGLSARELAVKIMDKVYKETGITATAGVGTNLYLAKIAMDIIAKHDDSHIGELTENSYILKLWNHQPLDDFWMIGGRTASKLANIGIFTMRDIAKADSEVLYRMFGIDAELMIDHAWGRETTTMQDIKNYRPKSNSLSSGQVLFSDYSFEEALIIVKEMTDNLCLRMIKAGFMTDNISLSVGYSRSAGIGVSRGSCNIGFHTGSLDVIFPCMTGIYEDIALRDVPIRRISISFNDLKRKVYEQYNLFTDYEKREKEQNLKEAVIYLKGKYGKNAVLRGMNLQEKATMRDRNMQIGGHKK
ncbi:MAG: DNA repair protein [Lachnospiraceae bacterium]|nr:DNA repair protein [Lachnospiraceae bacterium]